MSPLCSKPIKHSDITSKVDGTSLGEMLTAWKDAAASEVRVNMLDTLIKKKIGLNEVEQFSLGLRFGLKSEKMQKRSGKTVEEVVQAAMVLKLRDEKENSRELQRRKEDMKTWLAKKYHPKNKNFKKIVQYLRQEAWTEKKILAEKSKRKIAHLEEEYRKNEEDKALIPPGMENLGILSIFSKEKFGQIKED